MLLSRSLPKGPSSGSLLLISYQDCTITPMPVCNIVSKKESKGLPVAHAGILVIKRDR